MAEEKRRKLLIVDDEPMIRRVLVRTLQPAGYVCDTAEDASAARVKLGQASFDLILCDIRMPGDSGLVLLEEVARGGIDIATLVVTGQDDPATAKRAIDMGAYGYVVKPFTANEILINVINALARLDLERSRRVHELELESKLTERSSALGKAIKRLETHQPGSDLPWAETIDRLTRALALRDEETGRHIQRVGLYSELLANRRGLEGWTPADIRHASMLHDVGKIGVSDAILTKPGPLTPDQVLVVRRHCELGYRLLAGSGAPLLHLAASIALTHHERWDGSGYPYGIAGSSIPIEGRIVSVVDSFDAMTSDRVYRSALPLDQAVAAIVEGRGTQFDPDLVTLLVESLDDLVEIKDRHPDGDHGESPISVIVVDDQLLFAETLSRRLDSTADVTVMGRADSVEEGVRLALDVVPDVIVLNWWLPDGTGGELVRTVRSEHPQVRAVVLTNRLEDSLVAEAIEAGCAIALSKASAIDDVVAGVRAAHRGEVTIPLSRLSSAVARMPRRQGGASKLTPRELEILNLLSEGLSNEAIAESLTLSRHTVRNHVQSVIMKLGAHSKLEAVANGLRQGLIEVPRHFAAR